MSSTTCIASTFATSVDRITEREWTDLLPQFADASIYQTWAYGAVHWGEKQLSHLVLRRNGTVLAAAQLRLIRLPILRRGIAYLRWGPLWQRKGTAADVEVLREMSKALVAEYVSRRGLLLRVIPNCYQSEGVAIVVRAACEEHGIMLEEGVAPYHTFRLDVTPDLDALRKRFDSKWRNKLNGAERNALTVVEGTTDDLYGQFVSAYHEMMARKTFDTSVDVGEFGRIQSKLPDGFKMRIFLCRKEGRAMNGLAVAPGGDTAIYLLGATSDEGTKLKGSYLLHWRALQWLKERGIQWYDLGGINPEKNPGVYAFKKGFSGQEDYHLGRFMCSASRLSRAIVSVGERLAALRGSSGN
jgi:hypothetical protein